MSERGISIFIANVDTDIPPQPPVTGSVIHTFSGYETGCGC